MPPPLPRHPLLDKRGVANALIDKRQIHRTDVKLKIRDYPRDYSISFH